MYLLLDPEDVSPLSSSPDAHITSLQDFSDYYLPSTEALVRYFHEAAGFPVRDTFLKSIKGENVLS